MKRLITHEDLYSLSSYDYALPPERIAQSPAVPRDSSRLLVWDVMHDEVHRDNIFREIVNYLRPDDLLVLNDTRVIPARLKGIRESGGQCEVFLLRNISGLTWEALVRPARKIHEGMTININGLNAHVLEEKPEGVRIISFDCADNNEFMKFLDESGSVPLPPYIRNESPSMRESYQTVFAKNDGSVAAPTASLHFTPELLNRIRSMGVKIAYVTLHVGLGTFRPVMTQDIRDHEIHTEHCELPEQTAKMIRECKLRGGRVIASGTTAARTLETFDYSSGIRETRLFIYPGYKFKVVDALITNFHLPQSSLIMLVASFAANKANAYGHEERILSRLIEIYEECASSDWRFFSFGDAMFIV